MGPEKGGVVTVGIIFLVIFVGNPLCHHFGLDPWNWLGLGWWWLAIGYGLLLHHLRSSRTLLAHSAARWALAAASRNSLKRISARRNGTAKKRRHLSRPRCPATYPYSPRVRVFFTPAFTV